MSSYRRAPPPFDSLLAPNGNDRNAFGRPIWATTGNRPRITARLYRFAYNLARVLGRLLKLLRNTLRSFDSRTKAKQFAFLAAHYAEIPPRRESAPWATTGNRTQIRGSTNPCVDHYTIVAIQILITILKHLPLMSYSRIQAKKKRPLRGAGKWYERNSSNFAIFSYSP